MIKIAVDAGHHPMGIILWQMFISAVLLGVTILVRRTPVPVNRRSIAFYLIVAVIGTLIPNGFSLLALGSLPAGIMAIVMATVPIVSLCIAVLAGIEKFSAKRLLGVVLGVSALMIIALPEASLPDPAMAPWLLVALIAPVCYAVEGNFVAVRTPIDLSPVATLFGASVVGVLILAPVVWLGDNSVTVDGSWDVSRWAIVGSSFGHVIAYTGYLWTLGRAGAVFASQVGYVVTLTGVITAIVLLGEEYSVTVWAAVALMLAGVALVRPHRARIADSAVT